MSTMLGSKLINLDDGNTDKLKETLLHLRVGQRVTIQGSGLQVTARAGGRRMFDLNIPMNVPVPPHSLELKSLKSATEAAAALLDLHQKIVIQQGVSLVE